MFQVGAVRDERAVHQVKRLEDRRRRLGGFVLVGKPGHELLPGGEVVPVIEPAACAPTRVLKLGDLGETIKELLGTQAANVHAGKEARICFGRRTGRAGPLICLAGNNGADQILQIIAMVRELAGQLVEQFGVAGQVVGTLLVHRVGQADAEEVGPDPIGPGASEIGVRGANQPVGHHRARVVARFESRLRALEKAGADHRIFSGDGDCPLFTSLATLAAEESGEGPELRLRPVAARAVIVALGALQLDTQEQSRRGASKAFRLVFVDLVKEAGLFAALEPPTPSDRQPVIGLWSGCLGD